jgi:uncharacterized protein (UPF0305 family)
MNEERWNKLKEDNKRIGSMTKDLIERNKQLKPLAWYEKEMMTKDDQKEQLDKLNEIIKILKRPMFGLGLSIDILKNN